MKKGFTLKEIYTNKDETEQFDLVLVTAEDSSDLAGISITDNGISDGFEIIAKENIFLTEYGTPYCKTIEAKLDFDNISSQNISLEKEQGIKTQFIKYCINNCICVQIELCGSNLVDVQGKITSDKGDLLEMEITSAEITSPLGYASIDKASVTRIFMPVNRRDKDI